MVVGKGSNHERGLPIWNTSVKQILDHSWQILEDAWFKIQFPHRLIRSTSTAPRMTRPRTIFCVLLSTLVRFMPF